MTSTSNTTHTHTHTNTNTHTHTHTHQLISHLAASAAPALAWVAIGQPFDVIKTRLQTSSASQFRGTLHCVHATVHREGVAALWKGSVPALMISVPYSTVLSPAATRRAATE